MTCQAPPGLLRSGLSLKGHRPETVRTPARQLPGRGSQRGENVRSSPLPMPLPPPLRPSGKGTSSREPFPSQGASPIPVLHGGHGKCPGFCPGHPPGSAPRRELGLWAGGRQRPDSPLPGDLHSPDAPSPGPARPLPSDQPRPGLRGTRPTPSGRPGNGRTALPHPGPRL